MAINTVQPTAIAAQAQQPQLAPSGPTALNGASEGILREPPTERASAFFDRFVKAWEKTQKNSEVLTKNMPASVRPLIETQLIVSRLDMQAQLFTRVADVASSTVRKMQQMGGGS